MKYIYILIVVLTVGTTLKAQDIIVKNDKTEVKSKVTEVTDNVIKYKKWDMPDGPTYNLPKKDVFMIIYQNGQKEIISKIPQSATAVATPMPANPVQQVKTGNNSIDSIDYQSLPIRYSPGRIMYTNVSSNGSSAGAIGLQYSYRIIKNFINVGVDYHFYISGVGSGVTVTEGALYVEPYYGLNRAIGNYQDQNKGLFINAKIGGGLQAVDYNGYGRSTGTGGAFFGIGADYFFSDSFGISIGTFKLADFSEALQVGLAIKL